MSRKIVLEKNVRTGSSFLNPHKLGFRKEQRPIKALRSQVKPDPTLLLSVPVTGTKVALEYPTPDWFRSINKVDVSVIVPLYKSDKVVADLIASWPLEGQLKWEAIFVDDKCPNNSKETVLKSWAARKSQLQHPVGKLIVNTENKGFGLTCNAGAEFATGDHLIFLNADTILTPQWIEPMIKLFDDKKVGIVGNLQIKEGGTWDGTIDGAGSEWIWNSGSFVHIGRHSYQRKEIPVPYKPSQAPKDILMVSERDMVTGCCITVPKKIFNYLGGFNPNYRIGYWEDSELCLSIKELGYKVMFTPESKIFHKLSHSESGNHSFQNFNRQYFFNKWVNSGRIDDLVTDKRRSKPEIRNVLLKRSGAHGDVLLAAAVAPALKKKHNCNILFVTDCPEVLKGNPYVDRILTHSQISERQFQVYYDLDMAYEYRPFSNVLNAYAELVGVKTEDCKLHLQSEPIGEISGNFITLHVGNTNWKGRNWTKENFSLLSQEIQKLGYRVALIGRDNDFAVSCDIDLRGKTTIAQLASVIKRSTLFVGIDSFPMHVAQAVGTPGVCFFGCVNPDTRIVNDNMHGITAKSLPCLGCHHRKPTPCVVTNTCDVGGEPCLVGVEVSMMLKKIVDLLAK